MASAARTASRVVAVTQAEKENTEDQQYQEQLDRVAAAVGQGECVHEYVQVCLYWCTGCNVCCV